MRSSYKSNISPSERDVESVISGKTETVNNSGRQTPKHQTSIKGQARVVTVGYVLPIKTHKKLKKVMINPTLKTGALSPDTGSPPVGELDSEGESQGGKIVKFGFSPEDVADTRIPTKHKRIASMTGSQGVITESDSEISVEEANDRAFVTQKDEDLYGEEYNYNNYNQGFLTRNSSQPVLTQQQHMAERHIGNRGIKSISHIQPKNRKAMTQYNWKNKNYDEDTELDGLVKAATSQQFYPKAAPRYKNMKVQASPPGMYLLYGLPFRQYETSLVTEKKNQIFLISDEIRLLYEKLEGLHGYLQKGERVIYIYIYIIFIFVNTIVSHHAGVCF